MENICEWDNCMESGKFKAPLEKDNSRNYRWLCEDHIKLFNKNWDYFDGMDQNEIEDFLKSDLTWHRLTQKFGSSDNFFNILWNNALKFVKSCNFFKLTTSGRFNEFFFEAMLLPNLMSRSKFSEIALTADETAVLNLSFKSSCSSILGVYILIFIKDSGKSSPKHLW